MDSLQARALIAGVFFGIWPLLMRRSGLSGNFASMIFTVGILICVTPFAIGNVGNLARVNWIMAIGASATSAIGLLLFNGMLAKSTAENVSSLFVLMILTQTSIPAIYNIIVSGKLTAIKGFGFLFAIIAGILLAL